MNKLSIALRIIMGVGVVLLGLTAGFLKRSPWIILPLGVAFTVLFILGKLRHWRIGYQQEGLKGEPLAAKYNEICAATPHGRYASSVLGGNRSHAN